MPSCPSYIAPLGERYESPCLHTWKYNCLCYQYKCLFVNSKTYFLVIPKTMARMLNTLSKTSPETLQKQLISGCNLKTPSAGQYLNDSRSKQLLRKKRLSHIVAQKLIWAVISSEQTTLQINNEFFDDSWGETALSTNVWRRISCILHVHSSTSVCLSVCLSVCPVIPIWESTLQIQCYKGAQKKNQ